MIAEKKLLSYLTKDITAHRLVIERRVDDKFFFSDVSRILFRLLTKFYMFYGSLPNQEDVTYLLDTSPYSQKDRVDVLALYLEVLNSVPETNVLFVIDSLNQENKKRVIRNTLINSVKSLEDQNLEEAVQLLREGVSEVDINSEVRLEEDLAADKHYRVERYEKAKSVGDDRRIFVPSGFPSLDRVTGGMQPGELWVVAGWLKSGKSMFLLNAAYNAWKMGKSVLYVSAELSQVQVARRFDSLGSGLPYNRIKFGTLAESEEQQYNNFLNDVASRENYFKILFEPGCCTNVIDQRCKDLSIDKKPDLIIADYLGILTPVRKFNSREEMAGAVALELRNLAGRLQIPLFTAHQINRDGYLKGKSGAEYASLSVDVPRHADLYFSIRVKDEDEKRLSKRCKLEVNASTARDSECVSFQCDMFTDRMLIQESVGGF